MEWLECFMLKHYINNYTFNERTKNNSGQTNSLSKEE